MTFPEHMNSSQLVVLMIVLAALVCVVVFALRRFSDHSSYNYILRRGTETLRGLGLAIALCATVGLMSWTQYELEAPEYKIDYADIDEDIIEIPRTAIYKKVRKLPPPVKKIVPVEDLVEPVVEEPELVKEEVEAIAEPGDIEDPNASVAEPIVKSEPLPLPEPKPDEEGEIFVFAEQMPRFPGCEDGTTTAAEKKACSEDKLMAYIYDQLKYPSIARENDIQGRVILRFVVDKTGKISDVEIVRDIGGGCGDAAKKIIANMEKQVGLWTPGKQSGRKVNVRYTLPITFRLN